MAKFGEPPAPVALRFADAPRHSARRLILVGDIGGTSARFGCFVDGERRGLAEFDTAQFASGERLLTAAVDALPSANWTACCLAVAGPVLGERAQLTNADIRFSSRDVAAAVGTGRVALVNDLVALGTAVAHLPASRFERLGGTPAEGTKVVLAAGTGFGMGIVADGRCLPSEGGHARVAPVGAFERELLAFSESETAEHGGVVAWEHYLSGRGVAALHRAVCAVWGAKPPTLDAREIVRAGLQAEDPICHTTLETWVGMLATVSGGLAATALALGGVFLAGSVAMAVADLIRSPLFRRRFEDAAWAADFLADIPIYLVADPLAGMEGARLVAEGLAEG